MKLRLFAILLSLSATAAFARADLELKHVNLIRDNDLIETVRVYLNKRLVSYYTMGSDNSIDSDNGDISVKTVVENLEVKVSKNVRGLITAIEGDGTVLYVSFDSDCFSKECSYKFSLARGKYDLSEIPSINGYDFVKARRGVILKKNPLAKYATHLEINKDSLNIINTQKIKSGGH